MFEYIIFLIVIIFCYICNKSSGILNLKHNDAFNESMKRKRLNTQPTVAEEFVDVVTKSLPKKNVRVHFAETREEKLYDKKTGKIVKEMETKT